MQHFENLTNPSPFGALVYYSALRGGDLGRVVNLPVGRHAREWASSARAARSVYQQLDGQMMPGMAQSVRADGIFGDSVSLRSGRVEATAWADGAVAASVEASAATAADLSSMSATAVITAGGVFFPPLLGGFYHKATAIRAVLLIGGHLLSKGNRKVARAMARACERAHLAHREYRQASKEAEEMADGLTAKAEAEAEALV